MNSLVCILVSVTIFGIAPAQTSEEAAQSMRCITKCEDDNGIKHSQADAMQMVTGNCRTNDKFAECLLKCNNDYAVMMCYVTKKCANAIKEQAAKRDETKEQSAAYLCSDTAEAKHCALQAMEHMPASLMALGKAELISKQKIITRAV